MRPPFPITRLRRLRYNSTIRNMVSQTNITLDNLVMPLFVCTGTQVQQSIASMPGNYQRSIDLIVRECKELYELGIKSILLFGIPSKKDETGNIATKKNSIVPQAIRAIKKELKEMNIIADVCNCEYTTHGHCGTITSGDVNNDKTLQTLSNQSLTLAQSGVDIIAPSDMMDGRVGNIRKILDDNGFHKIPIMSYSVKYASAFYGPFRDAVESTPQFGDRKTYQMNYKNADEALLEVEQDIMEGADIIMVKPALSYLDIIFRVKQHFNISVAAYNVSGEFALIKAAAEKDWINEEKIMEEVLYSIKRAGADIIISYFAKDYARLLSQ